MATISRSAAWVNHMQDGETYSVEHLRPRLTEFKIPAQLPADGKPAKPARNLKVMVQYSHHCFTQGADKLSQFDQDHMYMWAQRPSDHRVFCPHRWALSKRLPAMVNNMAATACYSTGKHNYFISKDDANNSHYTVYFRVDRVNQTDLRLVIESAYLRTGMAAQMQARTQTTLIDILVNTR